MYYALFYSGSSVKWYSFIISGLYLLSILLLTRPIKRTRFPQRVTRAERYRKSFLPATTKLWTDIHLGIRYPIESAVHFNINLCNLELCEVALGILKFLFGWVVLNVLLKSVQGNLSIYISMFTKLQSMLTKLWGNN